MSGLWCGMRIVTAVADGSGRAIVDPDRLSPVVPVLEIDGRPWQPTLSGFTSAPLSLVQETEVFRQPLELARRYVSRTASTRR